MKHERILGRSIKLEQEPIIYPVESILFLSSLLLECASSSAVYRAFWPFLNLLEPYCKQASDMNCIVMVFFNKKMCEAVQVLVNKVLLFCNKWLR